MPVAALLSAACATQAVQHHLERSRQRLQQSCNVGGHLPLRLAFLQERRQCATSCLLHTGAQQKCA